MRKLQLLDCFVAMQKVVELKRARIWQLEGEPDRSRGDQSSCRCTVNEYINYNDRVSSGVRDGLASCMQHVLDDTKVLIDDIIFKYKKEKQKEKTNKKQRKVAGIDRDCDHHRTCRSEELYTNHKLMPDRGLSTAIGNPVVFLGFVVWGGSDLKQKVLVLLRMRSKSILPSLPLSTPMLNLPH